MSKIKLISILVGLCFTISFVGKTVKTETSELWGCTAMAASYKGKSSMKLDAALMYSSLVTGACAGAIGGPIGMGLGIGFTL